MAKRVYGYFDSYTENKKYVLHFNTDWNYVMQCFNFESDETGFKLFLIENLMVINNLDFVIGGLFNHTCNALWDDIFVVVSSWFTNCQQNNE